MLQTPAPSPPSRALGRLGSTEFIVLMALIQALQALAIDVMLPALGFIARDLSVSDPNDRQLVVGVYLLCVGLGSLLPGALADRFGRRPVLFTCLGGYVVFALAGAFARDFTMLLVARGCAGFVSSGLLVTTVAVIRDRFSGDRMARVQSLIGMIFMIVPMLAPTIGQAVLHVASWRWIFGIVAVMGTVAFVWAFLRLPETQHPEFRQPINVRSVMDNMRAALTTRSTFGYMFGIAVIQGALFGFLNSSQQLLGEHFGMGESFPLLFGLMASAMAVTSLVNSRIVERFGARVVSHGAVLVFIAAASAQLALALSGVGTVWQFVPIMTLSMCVVGFIGANFSSVALQPFSRIAGAAASLQAFIRLTGGALIGSLIGHAYDGSPLPLAIGLLVCGLTCLALILYSERGRLFRRRHGQVLQV